MIDDLIVHNLCVQNVLGRVGGKANLANDNKCRVFSRDSDLTTPNISPLVCPLVSQQMVKTP